MKTPVDSTTKSAPASAHGISSGFLHKIQINRKIKNLQNQLYIQALGKDNHPVDVVPDAKDSDWLLTEEKSLLILNLEFMVFPLTVNTVVLEHVGLHQSNTEINQSTNLINNITKTPNTIISSKYNLIS